jgi:hypothetical protein
MTMKHILTVLIVLLLAPLAKLQAEPQTISLAGTWQLRLENPRKHEIGMSKQWFKLTFAGDPAVLPGTLPVENRRTEAAAKPKIRPDSDDGLSGFTTLRSYRGESWYQREVDIPSGWAGKHIVMTMERCMWESYVWVDDAFQGTRNSLATPHVYDLSKPLMPGRHRLTIAVDNSNSIQAMSGTAAAQSKAEDVNNTMTTFFNQYDNPEGAIKQNRDAKCDIAGHQLWSSGWTGILERFELRASDPVRIVSAHAYPLVGQDSVRLKLRPHESATERTIQAWSSMKTIATLAFRCSTQ